jgi:hypothetical protein
MLPNVSAVEYREVRDRIQDRIDNNLINIKSRSILQFLFNYYVICYIICFILMVTGGPLFQQVFTPLEAFILSFVNAFLIMIMPLIMINLFINGPAPY